MRTSAFLAVAMLLVLLESNLFRVLEPLGAIVGTRLVHGFTPSLVLPLIIFLGVHEPSMPKGAMLSFALGYAQDILSGAPVGLFTFVSVAIWWLSRVAGVRLTAQTALPRMSLALLFALVQSAIVLILLAVFGNDSQRPVEIGTIVVPHALSTALCSPIMFRIAQRLRPGLQPVGTPAEVGAAAGP
jgi:rod shape-determining protein MreD